MDKGINGALHSRNKDTNSVKSDQQKTDITLLTTFHQNIKGIRSKSNELVCHLSHDLPQILCLTEHDLANLEIQTLNIDNYRLVHTTVENILKGGVCMFIHRSQTFSVINLDRYCIIKI